MAIRYSGDCEVRVGWDSKKGRYRGTVRDPYKRWTGTVPSRGLGAPKSPDAYDDAARRMIKAAEKKVGSFQIDKTLGRPRIRRIYQAPCPI